MLAHTLFNIAHTLFNSEVFHLAERGITLALLYERKLVLKKSIPYGGNA